jgi:hypothetical protein
MNLFNAKAALAGEEFIKANPTATEADIDWAAPPLFPARRHFQEAAREALRKKIRLYSWSIGVSDHATSGFSSSYEGAVEKIREMAKLYRKSNVDVKEFWVDDPDGLRLMSMDTQP